MAGGLGERWFARLRTTIVDGHVLSQTPALPVKDRPRVCFSRPLGYSAARVHRSDQGAKTSGERTMIARLLAAALLLVGLHVLPAHAQGAAPQLPTPELVKIPFKGAAANGGDLQMVVYLYKPVGAGPFPVVIFSHGRGTPEVNQNLVPALPGHAGYWMRKGFAVVAPLRPGYGATGGPDNEAPGHTWRGATCVGVPDYANTAKVAGAAVTVTLNWVRAQPWANRDKIILEGESVGGMTTVVLGSQNPPGVIGFINFAGGAGGSPDTSPGHSCREDLLRALFAQAGTTARIPSLWLYAENDLYWGPDAPKEWHKRFAAGGSKTSLVATGPVPNADGHRLLALGGAMWAPPLDAFVKSLGF